MFTKSASFYEDIYTALGKDYAREAQQIHTLIQEQKRCPGNTLLDVGCGPGGHIAFWQPFYEVEGLDLEAGMLAIARQHFPEVKFHQADMVDFDLDRRFDVIVCLFGSIGYVKTLPKLQQAVRNMARHLQPGGVIIVEPWLTPESYRPGLVHAHFVDQPELKIARMNISEVEDGVSILNFHYLIATPDGIDHFTERHELGLFSHDDYLAAFRASGLEVAYDPEGLIGRGLYIGSQPFT
jgi:ubiquinone/menaquinone biosynthesis C-methylase UbiE